MGILDDAIREHLDLKRRSGADPAEIERLEHEALGPVRRVQENGEPHFEAEQSSVTFPDAYPDEAAVADDTLPAEELEIRQEEELLPGESLAPEYAMPEVDQPPQSLAEPPLPLAEPPVPPAAAAPPPPAPAAPAPEPEVGGETVEYDVEAAQEGGESIPDPAGPESGEDVLEETPEFLQDTPEHDRLWFEQRPPRDFDFDS